MIEGQKASSLPIIITKIFLLTVGMVISILGISFYIQQQTPPIVSPLADGPQPTQRAIFYFLNKSTTKEPNELKKKIKTLVGPAWNNYSVYVQDYASPFTMGLDETVTYNAASVNKIPILAALYTEVQKGSIDLTRVITLQQQDIQDYGTGSMRYDAPGTTYSIKTLAKLMMQKSDNTAAYILANHILTEDTIQTYVTSWGMTQTNMEENTTSTKDMALLLEKIYTGKITNQALTGEMLAFMKDSDFEERIPKLLPKACTIFHKIGNGPGNIHDVGIVQCDKIKFSVSILTSDITDEKEAEDLSAKIAQLVYTFLK